jgi:serine/threonine protein kinase
MCDGRLIDMDWNVRRTFPPGETQRTLQLVENGDGMQAIRYQYDVASFGGEQYFITLMQGLRAAHADGAAIPEIYDFAVRDQKAVYLMEVILGETLSALRETEQIPAQQRHMLPPLKLFLKDLLKTLILLQKHGVIHRDIRPENIFYEARTKRLILIDFDQARPRDMFIDIAQRGHLGNVHYFLVPPNWASTENPESWDVYSLAWTAIVLLCGYHIPNNQGAQPVGDQKMHLRETLTEMYNIPRCIRNILGKAAMEKEARRFANARGMLNALRWRCSYTLITSILLIMLALFTTLFFWPQNEQSPPSSSMNADSITHSGNDDTMQREAPDTTQPSPLSPGADPEHRPPPRVPDSDPGDITPSPAQPAAIEVPLEITSPLSGQAVSSPLTISGRARPGSKVWVFVDVTGGDVTWFSSGPFTTRADSTWTGSIRLGTVQTQSETTFDVIALMDPVTAPEKRLAALPAARQRYELTVTLK